MRDSIGKVKKWFGTGFIIVSLITGILWIKEYVQTQQEITVLARNPPGMGDAEFYLEARTKENSFPVNIQIQERVYTEDEMEDVFERGKEWLDSVWLGENTSSDHITKNLYFPTYIEELGLTVRWEVENNAWIRPNGTVIEDANLDNPNSIEVCAVVSYGKEERVYIYEIHMATSESTEEKDIEKAIVSRLKMLDDTNRTKEEINLPASFLGEQLQWYVKRQPLWPKIFLFGNMIVVLLYFTKEERKMQQMKDRNKALSVDYPEIVYQMVLLVGAGMTIRNAWEKMTEAYEREKSITGKMRWGYEEMETTLREMNYGIAEIKAYENFGNRCGNQNYIRFSALLIQHVKRGAKGMNQLLMQEVTEAEILWRENSRKRAEEAGTKLLFPMILMMSVVFAVLMIPAFLSMSIG